MSRIALLPTAWLDGKKGGGTARVLGMFLAGVLLALAGVAHGYDRYSVNRNATNCRACHGDFRASPYTSRVDGMSWLDDLHDVHRNVMLDGDCVTCHSSGPRFPVLTGSSAGGIGLDPISCAGCHGRAEDGTGTGSQGYGAGLRQHHWNAGRTVCLDCHADADPGAFTPVAENILPPYYSDNDPDHTLIPSDPCNPEIDGFPEDYAATTLGLDNDGNDLYDEIEDTVACPEPDAMVLLGAGIGFLLIIGRNRRR